MYMTMERADNFQDRDAKVTIEFNFVEKANHFRKKHYLCIGLLVSTRKTTALP